MCPCEERRAPPGVYYTPPPARTSYVAAMPLSERRRPPFSCSSSSEKRDPFHIVHKVPSGDSPYVRAKHAQLIDKDPNRAISLFWTAINAGDRVDSALKDMVVVMKQLDRSDEGIEAIRSFRYLCSFESQDSIDNLLLELYKKSGRVEEEAELLEHKLKTLEQGMGFGGRVIRAKRVQGKHVTMTIEQEKARVLGNLGWVHLQLHNYGIAEQHYRRALGLEQDKNKICNLAICLMRMGRIPEAKSLLDDVRDSPAESECRDEPFAKSYDRAVEMLAEIESKNPEADLSDKFYAGCSFANGMKENIAPGIANKNYSHVSSSPASVGPNSAGLYTQPRGCRAGMYEEETRGAARKLLFEKPKPFASEQIKILKRGEEEPKKRKKLDLNMIQYLHEFIKDTADGPKNESKKSWADIAEEEEEEERLQAET
ncbi:Tetratricopeptide repeat-containing domain [Arabidopsis thaliana x Arabidopsis arenosa]|uniref:Tetratricopeptide repeat-containing domain n=1 Tax=Arabidopsis thaliana x Arabidopsis arenosa TaxID=1240361 RepID=A0A8T1Y5Y9_9BRAS|nr:Tetratricopeptide repeat-containing domain [Arabidopsis thaliana x Arabidopsis arenosa]